VGKERLSWFKKFDINDDEDKWTVYIFIRNLYFICAIYAERLSR
jgi:hypothetical protein